MSGSLPSLVVQTFADLVRNGALAEDRQDQVAMALAVAEAIEAERPLAVVAGTGIGKTWAYLVPAILSERRVVISTGTRALQEQLARRDLPAITASLGRSLGWTTLKGRQNYLCQQRLRELVDPDDDLVDLVRWAHSTETGDRDELVDEPDEARWRRLAVTSEDCPGRDRCPMGASCWSERAREVAAERELVITTHHLYAAGVFASQQILPPHDVVIFDEAHLVEEVIRDSLSTRVDPATMAALGRAAGALGAGEATSVVHAARVCHDRLAPLVGRWWPAQPSQAVEPLATAAEALRALATAARGRAREQDDPRWERIAHAAALQLENVQLSTVDDPPRGAWVDGDDRRPVLRSAAAELGADQVAHLWAGRTPVFTSATWPDPGPASLGLVDNDPLTCVRLVLDSPLPHRAHGLLYCPTNLPDPRSAGWAEAVYAELVALIRAAGGRTLALFTSWQALRGAVEAVTPHLTSPVLVQGETGRAELLRRLLAEPTSCAFGTIGLGQGIDVPGASLTLVTLDRLPFPPVRDPKLALRRAALGPDAFATIDLLRAATTLAQMAGRLIRTAEDRGVFAVLDRRLATAGYRATLLDALPPFRRSTSRSDAEAALRDASGSA